VLEETLKAVKRAQFNLDDFAGTRRPTLGEKVRKTFGLEPHAPLSLAVDDEGVVGLNDVRCVRCGAKELVENGTNPRTVDLPYAGAEVLRMRRYRCTACGADFTTPLADTRKKNTTRTGSGRSPPRSGPRSPSP